MTICIESATAISKSSYCTLYLKAQRRKGHPRVYLMHDSVAEAPCASPHAAASRNAICTPIYRESTSKLQP